MAVVVSNQRFNYSAGALRRRRRSLEQVWRHQALGKNIVLPLISNSEIIRRPSRRNWGKSGCKPLRSADRPQHFWQRCTIPSQYWTNKVITEQHKALSNNINQSGGHSAL